MCHWYILAIISTYWIIFGHPLQNYEYTGVYCTQYTHNNQLVFLGISALVHANDTYALSEVDSEQFDFGYISITTTIKL